MYPEGHPLTQCPFPAPLRRHFRNTGGPRLIPRPHERPAAIFSPRHTPTATSPPPPQPPHPHRHSTTNPHKTTPPHTNPTPRPQKGHSLSYLTRRKSGVRYLRALKESSPGEVRGSRIGQLPLFYAGCCP